jgi:formyltetrahydrofolate-dependent phosphoribosylglycinamide formyltransferase
MEPVRVAVLISGSGRTMVNIAERARTGELPIEVVAVVSSREGTAGVDRARDLGLPVHVVPRKRYDSPDAFSDHVWAILRDSGAELVCMAGFLSLLRIPPDFVGRVLNIHPALLPRHGGQGMYGHRVHEAVLAAGDAVSGCTVHVATDEYDRGPIVLQREVPVLTGDTAETLADRVFSAELEAYPEAIRVLAERIATERR